MKRIIAYLKDEHGLETLEGCLEGAFVSAIAATLYTGALGTALTGAMTTITTAVTGAGGAGGAGGGAP